MPVIKQINIKKIFEKASGHKLPEPKPYNVYPPDRPSIAGNLNTK